VEHFLPSRAKRLTVARDPNRANPILTKTGVGFNQHFRFPYTGTPGPALVTPTKGNTGLTLTVPTTGMTTLPKQYNKTQEAHGHLAHTDIDPMEPSSVEQEVDDSLPDDEWDGTCFWGIVITAKHDERVGLRTSIADLSSKGYSVFDSGADTMMLGVGWHFIDYQVGRFVNICGFDATCSNRNGLRVVTAVTVMRDDNQHNVFVVAYEAVDNSPNKTSLLSLGQMQHNHLVVDASRQRDGGKQQIHNPQSGAIPLAFLTGMYRIASRPPTAKDMAMLPRIHLTHKQTWHPHCNNADDSLVIPPLITPAQLTYHSNSFDSKSDGTSGLRGSFMATER
jgi:hypothetical protein